MRIGAGSAFLGLTITGIVLAQPVFSQTQSRAGRWQVDWGDRRCSLIRHPVGEQPMLVLRTIPGSRAWELMFIRRSWPSGLLGDRPIVFIRLQAETAELERRALSGRTSLGATISVYFGQEFVDRFAEAQSITFRAGDRSYQVSTPRARDAITVMRECEDDALRQWGIDPVAFRAVSVPARGDLTGAFSDADYPAQAIRSNTSGFSIVRMTIDTNGRVSECSPVAGTDDAVLDRAACRVLQSRATFSPARDANGNAIQSQFVTSIDWRMARNWPPL